MSINMYIQSRHAGISKDRESKRYTHSIKGVVVKQYTKIVRLYNSETNEISRTVLTDHLGRYSFDSLPIQPYFVIIRDDTKQYNAVIQDNIIPK